jgi:hypothetical protein
LAAVLKIRRQIDALNAYQRFVRDAIARHGAKPKQAPAPGQSAGQGTGKPDRSGSGSARAQPQSDGGGKEMTGSYVVNYRIDGKSLPGATGGDKQRT